MNSKVQYEYVYCMFGTWACMYSLSMLPSSSCFSECMRPFCQRMGDTSINEIHCFNQLLIQAKVLHILVYCYYWLGRRSCMHLLFKFELKIPQSYPQTAFCHSFITNWSQNYFSELRVNMPWIARKTTRYRTNFPFNYGNSDPSPLQSSTSQKAVIYQ